MNFKISKTEPYHYIIPYIIYQKIISDKMNLRLSEERAEQAAVRHIGIRLNLKTFHERDDERREVAEGGAELKIDK